MTARRALGWALLVGSCATAWAVLVYTLAVSL